MKYYFYLGGAGNVYFQLLRAKEQGGSFRFSNFFITPLVRDFFNHTKHPDLYKKFYHLPANFFLMYPLLMIVMFLDLMANRLLGRTFLTNFDLGAVKSKALIYPLINFGYFQENVSLSMMRKHSDIISNSPYSGDLSDVIVVHVRGGDFRNQGISLNSEYYRNAFSIMDLRDKTILVVTDDPSYAGEVLVLAGLDISNCDIFCGDGVVDFYLMNRVVNFIGSNSTFSLVASITSPVARQLVYPDEIRKKFICDDVTDVELNYL
ncbi:hypothetical protein [Thalassolituus oleivorans]|uniref:hypothetical protein n=1 Tax=Thalassolituus oleivorans TaxID=187493 RepID=UPI0024092FCB|nr:hypothetical protein [Thalassolituus oleivorans]MDF1641265.1 hypothetical protein [Thalassolituus oleivorans]